MTINRRTFLSHSAGASAALGMAAWRHYALAAEESNDRQPGNKVVLGMIGTGGRCGYLMSQLMSRENIAIAAVCDVNRQNLSRAAAAAKDGLGKAPAQYDDFRRVLDDRSIDAVVVATPHHWHSPIAVRALEAGKHVYVEKPASHVFREGRRLIEAAERNKRVFQHGTQMRSSEVTEAAGKVLASGVLGPIKQAKAWGVEPRGNHAPPAADSAAPDFLDWDRWLGPAPQRPFNANRYGRWNSFREYGNGEIGGDGIHDIDMARWGLGVVTHPVRITAHGSRIQLEGESDFPDNMLVAYQYDDDKVLIYENRNFAPYKMHGWDNGNIFYGTEGYMVFSRRGYFQTFLGAKEEKGAGMQGSDGVPQHLANFVASVRGEAAPNANAQVAHLSCGLVHLGEIAYRTGRVLHFDPQAEQAVGDDEANSLLDKQHRAPWTFEAG